MLANPRRHPLLLLLLIAGILRIIIAWAPLGWLLRYTLSDDTFYYLTIARNAAHGYGFTFDMLAETNGFHPLWMIVLLPVYFFVEDRTLAVHVVLTVSAFIDVCSIYLLHSLLRRCNVSDFSHWTVLFLYAFAPILLSYAGPLNGLETGLNVLCILLYLALYQRALMPERTLGTKNIITFGFVSGLLFLVRTDNVILLAVTYCYIAFSRKNRMIPLSQLALSGAIAAVVAAPWFIWSYLNTGAIVQVSALSLGFAMKTFLHTQGWGLTDYIVQFIRNLANTAAFFPVFLYDTRIISFPSGVIVGMMVSLVVAVIGVIKRMDLNERMLIWARLNWIAAPIMAGGLFVLIHTLRAVYMRGWYYASLFPVLFIVLAVLLDLWLAGGKATPGKRNLKPRYAILGGMLLAFLISSGALLKLHYGEIDKWEMVKVMNSTLPPASRVGSWNAGLYGYFFENGTLVGLDGLVNNEVYDHMLDRTVQLYCREKEIEYLVDPVGSLRFAQPFWMHGRGSVVGFFVPIDSVLGQKENDWIVLGRLNN